MTTFEQIRKAMEAKKNGAAATTTETSKVTEVVQSARKAANTAKEKVFNVLPATNARVDEQDVETLKLLAATQLDLANLRQTLNLPLKEEAIDPKMVNTLANMYMHAIKNPVVPQPVEAAVTPEESIVEAVPAVAPIVDPVVPQKAVEADVERQVPIQVKAIVVPPVAPVPPQAPVAPVVVQTEVEAPAQVQTVDPTKPAAAIVFSTPNPNWDKE